MIAIAVIGLGYVGLPLAVAFSKKYAVVGFDINKKRVDELNNAFDFTNEVSAEQLQELTQLQFSSNPKAINGCNIFIITVPTPINQFKAPDLSYLLAASALVGGMLKEGDLVIYESTVYPGCTEEDCVPVLELNSGLVFNKDFFCGYSPERINPGDKKNTLINIKKVTSGSTPAIAKKVDNLYNSIITAGTYCAPSIRVAEAAKAIENAQRDINISFVNELALIFDKMGLDTQDVLDAAATKWNFLPFKPGLVGGHCIGVDPYYLAHKSASLGYTPQVILSGRRVNDGIGHFIANKVVKLMIQKEIPVKNAKALILGFTFKENCGDIRNTKVVDIVMELESFGLDVEIHDPVADPAEVKKLMKQGLQNDLSGKYEVIILCVAHQFYFNLDLAKLRSKSGSVVFDCKGVFDRVLVDGRL
ncbi:MAG: nucleotide sugar dehydrogenase [Bacteroidetes bacterium]|nr:nucleotide sugar dehydrogenase [Bacteroidota bacterium]